MPDLMLNCPYGVSCGFKYSGHINKQNEVKESAIATWSVAQYKSDCLHLVFMQFIINHSYFRALMPFLHRASHCISLPQNAFQMDFL